MRIVAIIAVRNGANYAAGCLQHLAANGIEAAVLDQMSHDGTYELCAQFKGKGLCHLERYPFPGYFSLHDQLLEKQKLIERLDADWVVHQDIDERLESARPETDLAQVITNADREGYGALNFNEFVFIPYVSDGESFFRSRYYYFFENEYPRLIRAWKRSLKCNNIDFAGHRLRGDFKLCPVTHNLRHYIFTSQAHAMEKYAKRSHSRVEIERGWHGNRMSIPPDRLAFPAKSRLHCLSGADSRQFDTSCPQAMHYWEW